MRRLVINADDGNLTPGCDRAIAECVAAGVVTSVSCLPGPMPPYPCGVHLDGDDWRGQIQAFGGAPTHLDTHRHAHRFPDRFEVYADLCAELGCVGVPLSARQRDSLRARGMRCADFAEIRWLDGKFSTLTALLAADFVRHETVHLMCHPGYADADLRAVSSMVEVRERERSVLLSPAFKRWITSGGIELIGMQDLPVDPLAKVDILFLSWHRAEFSAESLRALAANTDWRLVRRLIVYTDGEPMREGYVARLPIPSSVLEYNQYAHGGPVAIMSHYLSGQPATWFAKIDNDTIVPPGWLTRCVEVLRANPNVDLLGVEAVNAIGAGNAAELTDHIGGIGLMRSAVFARDFAQDTPHGDRSGFTQYQWDHPEIVKAWLKPSLPVILLDRLPFDPWASLSCEYEAKGWQRPWKRYTEADAKLWEWWK